jgi:DNA-directed RNA polymerase specialized sigma subunit
MLNSMTTSFVARLKRNDQAAWFELWETFGPVLRSQLMKWGKGRVGSQTVQDLSQETLAALSDSIERYDPSRGGPIQHVAVGDRQARLGRRNGQTRRSEAWVIQNRREL